MKTYILVFRYVNVTFKELGYFAHWLIAFMVTPFIFLLALFEYLENKLLGGKTND